MDLNNLVVPESLSALAPKPFVTCTIEGIIDEDDLRELVAGADPNRPRNSDDDPSDLKKIREKHHHVARLVADGMAQRLVAQICGYTEEYISVLLNNPSMQELVGFYRIQNGAAAKVVTEKLKTVGLKALERLEEQMESAEGGLSNLELIATAKLGLDRGGHGPASKQHVVNENHTIDHARLVELQAEAIRRNHDLIIPASEVRRALPPKAPEGE